LRPTRSGRWEGRIAINGRRYTVTGDSKSEAAALLKAKAEQVRAQGAMNPDATVADALEAHLVRLESRVLNGTMKKTTAKWWRQMLKHAEPLHGTLLADLTPTRVEKWISGVPGSPRTRRGAFQGLAAALETARRDGMTAADPFRHLEAPPATPVREPRYATDEDIAALLEAPEPWRSMFAVLAYTGLRRGEMLALRWEDVDMTNRRLRVRAGKTSAARRNVPVSEKLAAILDAAGPESSGLVFVSESGTPVDPRNFNRAFTRYAPLGLTPHGLRHGAATRMLLQGAPIQVVSAVLGHSSTSITADVYLHSLSAAERDAVNLL
jgi:integrase